MPDVYATARGPLARVASPLAARARARRHARFFARARLAPGARGLGAAGGEEVSVPRRAEVAPLFGPAHAARFAGLVKSWVCVRAPGVLTPTAGEVSRRDG